MGNFANLCFTSCLWGHPRVPLDSSRGCRPDSAHRTGVTVPQHRLILHKHLSGPVTSTDHRSEKRQNLSSQPTSWSTTNIATLLCALRRVQSVERAGVRTDTPPGKLMTVESYQVEIRSWFTFPGATMTAAYPRTRRKRVCHPGKIRSRKRRERHSFRRSLGGWRTRHQQ